MNDSLSWFMHLLVHFLFHYMTSLHPPSNDFTLAPLMFSVWGKPQQKGDVLCLDNAPFLSYTCTVHVLAEIMASFSDYD